MTRPKSIILEEIRETIHRKSGKDAAAVVTVRDKLRVLDAEIKQVREAHQIKLGAMLEERERLVKLINSLE